MNRPSPVALVLAVSALIALPLPATPSAPQERAPLKSAFSLDLDYARIGLENDGWGIGFGYERVAIDHLSVKGGFAHMTFKTTLEGVYCTTVNVALLANWYPLYGDMNRLYLGLGCGTDFLNYFGPAVERDADGDTIIYLESVAGWKEILFRRVMLDVHAGYNLILSGAENYPGFTRYGKEGFIPGITVKIIFR